MYSVSIIVKDEFNNVLKTISEMGINVDEIKNSDEGITVLVTTETLKGVEEIIKKFNDKFSEKFDIIMILNVGMIKESLQKLMESFSNSDLINILNAQDDGLTFDDSF